jgi:O-antigen ligase
MRPSLSFETEGRDSGAAPEALPSGPGAAAGGWRRAVAEWPRSSAFQTASTLWFAAFCAGFSLLPGEASQRLLFYGFVPFALPAVALAAGRVWRSPLAWAIAAFLVYMAASALWSVHWLSVGDAARKSFWIGFFLVLCALRPPDTWRPVVLATLLFAAGVAIWSMADFLPTCSEGVRFTGYGQHANSNYTAMVAGMVGLLGLSATLSARGGPSVVLLAAQAPVSGLLAVTGSRAALYSYLAGLGLSVLLVILPGTFRGVGRVVAMLAVCLAVGLFTVQDRCVVHQPGAAQEGGMGWLTAQLARGDKFRILIWTENLHRVAQRPVFGYGVTTPDEVFLDGERVGTHAHDMFLAQAFYGGVTGLLLWAGVLVLALRVAWKRWRAGGDTTLVAALLFLFLVGLVDVGPVLVDVQAIWFYVWLPLGIALSCDLADRNPRRSTPAEAPPPGPLPMA